jgi:hypothetical protein
MDFDKNLSVNHRLDPVEASLDDLNVSSG